eukprot:6091218-Pleurochrysis_carterae.AAC.2
MSSRSLVPAAVSFRRADRRRSSGSRFALTWARAPPRPPSIPSRRSLPVRASIQASVSPTCETEDNEAQCLCVWPPQRGKQVNPKPRLNRCARSALELVSSPSHSKAASTAAT